MTYQNKYDVLLKDYSEKSNIFLKLEKKVTQVNGFGDIGDINELFHAKQEWQSANNAFYEFLSFTKKMNIKPNDKLIIK